MFLTNVLLKKAKSKEIMVQLQSVVSGHTFNKIRERLGDKLEVIRFDPWNLFNWYLIGEALPAEVGDIMISETSTEKVSGTDDNSEESSSDSESEDD